MYITEAWNIIKNGEMITLIGDKIWYLTKQSDSSLLKKAKDLGISDQDFLSNKWIQGYLGFYAPPVLKPHLGKAEKVEEMGINYEKLFRLSVEWNNAIGFYLETDDITKAKEVVRKVDDIIEKVIKVIDGDDKNPSDETKLSSRTSRQDVA